MSRPVQTAELLREINQDQDGGRGRARHGLRPRARRQGDVPARGLGAGRRHHRSGLDQRPRRRSVSGSDERTTCSKSPASTSIYGAAQALRGISLKAEPGKVTCVLGRNGVGKSSLLRALVGQKPVKNGTIMFEGKDITTHVRRSIAPAAASPMCRRAARSSRCSPCRKISRPALRRCARDQREMPDDVFYAVSGAEDHARPPRRRSVRRPAAATAPSAGR